MFKFKLKAELALRLGLALVLIYAGVNILIVPQIWESFIPSWLETIINPQTFLIIYAVFEILLGFLLLINFQTVIVALLIFFNFLTILLFYGIDEVTFRDFGLMMAALALFLIKNNIKPRDE